MPNKTKLIPLSQGQVAMVDAEDFVHLNQWKWHAQKGEHRQSCGYYAVRNRITKTGKKRVLFMHVFLMGNPKGKKVDHWNGDSLDNRKDNLRICSQQQNSFNSKKPKSNTSGFKGVHWHKKAGAWESYVCFNYKKIYLGLFDDKVEAARAYNLAAKKHFGSFAKLNPV